MSVSYTHLDVYKRQVYYNAGQPAESNEQFVERVKRLAAEVGKTIAAPDEAREILGLK